MEFMAEAGRTCVLEMLKFRQRRINGQPGDFRVKAVRDRELGLEHSACSPCTRWRS